MEMLVSEGWEYTATWLLVNPPALAVIYATPGLVGGEARGVIGNCGGVEIPCAATYRARGRDVGDGPVRGPVGITC